MLLLQISNIPILVWFLSFVDATNGKYTLLLGDRKIEAPCRLEEAWKWQLLTRKRKSADSEEVAERLVATEKRNVQVKFRKQNVAPGEDVKLLDYIDAESACRLHGISGVNAAAQRQANVQAEDEVDGLGDEWEDEEGAEEEDELDGSIVDNPSTTAPSKSNLTGYLVDDQAQREWPSILF